MSHITANIYFAIFLLLASFFLSTFASSRWPEPPLWTNKDPCPSIIRATVPSHTPFGRWEAVHNALKTCSNITELDLRNEGPSCTEFPDGYNLPFRSDGSDRYLSAPHVLSLYDYDFQKSELEYMRSGAPDWANEDGTWPVSNSTNAVIRWATEMYYRSRWKWDELSYNFKYPAGLTGYSAWQDEGIAQRWYDRRHAPIERLSMENMQLWLEAMDFSKVHTLSIANGNTWPKGKGLLINLPPALTHLKNLSIQGRWLNWRTYLAEWEATPGPLPKNKWSSSPPPPASHFILAIPPTLKKLIWKESETVQEDIFEPVLKHHGSTLQHLEWTNHERGFKPRPILTQNQLRSLGEWAPGLTSLTIDLERRNGTLPQEELKILARALPKLRSLVVHLNLLDEGLLVNNTGYGDKKKHASDSVLDVGKGLDLFQGLRNAKVGEKLDSVEFLQGEWTNDWPFGRSLWEDRYWVRCWLDEKDEGPGARCDSGHDNAYDADF
ncbi:cytochrome p450 monooxygenase [Fusarium mexicanum]|uniref:Cytochrome p450 monooxygenase n=1 Tax=Fusarium mexicanum TaxID=751941 RepID=A0A8H5MR75_9HYPO|nr:cytochrome p450 monooxygenase [Fusarium mexicanum]